MLVIVSMTTWIAAWLLPPTWTLTLAVVLPPFWAFRPWAWAAPVSAWVTLWLVTEMVPGAPTGDGPGAAVPAGAAVPGVSAAAGHPCPAQAGAEPAFAQPPAVTFAVCS